MLRGRSLRHAMVAGATSLTLILATVPQSVGATESEESTTTANVSLVTSVPEPCTLLDDPSDDETPQADATSEASSSSEASAPSQPEVSDSPEPSPSSSAPTPTTAPALESPAPVAPSSDTPSSDAPSLDARELDLVTSEPSATVDAPATTAPESDAPESEDPTTNPSETAVAPVPAPASASPSATASPSPTSTLRVSCVESVTDATAVAGDMSVALSWVVPDGADDTYVTVGDGRIYKVPAPLAQLEVTGLRNGKEESFALVAANTAGSGESVTIRATPVSGTEGEVAGIIVAFDAGTDVRDGQQLVPGEERVFRTDLSVNAQIAEDVHVIDLADGVTPQVAEEIATQLEEDPRVVWAEPDMFVSPASEFADLTAIDDSEYTTRQWNLWDTYGVGVGQGATRLADEYVANDGTGASVAVIDTGITSHPDLDPRIDPGFDFVSSPVELAAPRVPGGSAVPFDGDSEDEGRYGVLGWDANPQDPGDWSQVAPVRDSSWHGTHVAGIIAAQPDGEGAAGIAPGARIVPVRALSWRGGLMSDVAAAITWSTGGVVDGVAAITKPVDVVNMSFAMRGACPATLQSAINGAIERGATLVAAAGNANEDVAAWAPANCEGVIAVAATGRDGKRAPYSNWGAGIDVSAPGGSGAIDGGVVSTSNAGLQGPDAPAFTGREGTSVAAAHVAAIAARIAGARPEALPADIHAALVGRSSVRSFAADACDVDPARTCGSGIVQIAAANAVPGVNMNLSVGSDLIADGSTVAAGSTVTVGTSALLSPGSGYRELRTTLDDGTVLSSGSAVAPEGWTIEYSANDGSSWSTTQPTASTVTDVRAKATVAAGLIDGTSQVYSSETTAAIPSSNFSASTGGDGWDTFFYEDYVFNIFHHADNTVIDCHYRSTGDRCTGYKATFGGYRASMRSGGWVDATTGKLYALTNTGSGQAGALCVDVSQSSGPVSCGFIPLSTTLSNSTSWQYLTESEYVGRRFFGAAYGYDSTTGSWGGQLLCYDAATEQVCPNTPVSLVGATYGVDSYANVRPFRVGTNIMVKTSTRIYCFIASTMQECADQSKWPVTINANSKTPAMPHVTAAGVPDGVCYESGCFDLNGDPRPLWTTPFVLGGVDGNNWAQHAVTGGLGGTRYFWAGNPTTVFCFDFATNLACTGGFPKQMPEQGLVYSTRPDPENESCIWVNGDAGRISVFDAQTGNTGCSNNPVITLQPSQFAPRYACSTTNGIQEWTTLRLVSIGGGGSAGSVKLTVRDATGSSVSGWTDRSVSLNTPVDMTGLSVSTTGSRPTFSFAFSSVTGTISTAVIALDYKGRGPELCVDTIATAPSPPRNVTLGGTLVEQVGAQETFTAQRSFIIGSSASLAVQTVPTAPQSLSGTGINTTATLTFQPPASNGNLTITGYQVSSDNGSTWDDATVTDNGDGTRSIRVSGLAAGSTYDFKVAAVNSLGRGAAASTRITMQLASMGNLVDTPVNLGPVTLQPRTSEGRTITYTSSTPSICTVPASAPTNTVTLVAVGTCTIRAQEPGDSTTTPAIAALDQTGSFQVLAAYFEPELPDVPRNLTLTPSNTQVSLAWNVPLSDGNSALTDYVVQYKSGSTWIPFNDGVSTTRTAVVPGLTNGISYSFRVAAVNAMGTGTFTDSVSGTPATVPGSSTSLAASGTGTSRTLTWTAPSSTGGSAITDYSVEYKLSADATWTTFADGVRSSTGATVTGLVSGSSYDFRVAAVNSIGTGAYVSTVNLSATSGNEQVALTWTQPTFTGGEVFSHYAVQYRVSGTSTWLTFADPVSTTATTVTGLTNGTTYDFRVANVTTSSTSSYSSVATETPRTTPAAPSDVAATPGNRQVTLAWSAPSSGGSAITDYVIQFKASSDSSWTTVTDPVSATTGVVVTSLPNGTSFDFRVAAVNAVGTGSYSATVVSTPRTTAGAVSMLTATAGNASTQLSWSSPSTTGGAAVSDYLIEYRASTAFEWSTFVDGVSTSTTATVVGLVNGTLYEFRVSPINAAGTGTTSGIVSARPFTTPGDPGSVAATMSGTTASVSWTAPTSTGGSAITGYSLQYKLASVSSWTTWSRTGSATSVSESVTGLTSGASYDFRVAAVNAAGTGSYVSTVNLTATPGDGSVTLTWPEPNLGSDSLTRYEVYYGLSGTDLSTVTPVNAGTSRSYTVSSLANGTAYDFQVKTVTSGTASLSSVVSATPVGAPSAPQSLAATAGNTQVSLSWAAPSSNGGSAVTDYVIQYRLASDTLWTTFVDGVGTGTSRLVAGLTNGSAYDFRVAAVNATGTGAYASTGSSVTPYTVPGTPRSLAALAGVTSVQLSWLAPTSDGGSAVTAYAVQYKTSSAVTWTTWTRTSAQPTDLSETVTGLTNGTLYQFRVVASNAAGSGAESTAVSATPKTVPGTPTGLAASIGDGTVSLTWTAPSDNGGSAITDYVIEMKASSEPTTWTTVSDGVRTLPSATVSGLVNSTSYDFRVSAVNEVGPGSSTSSVSATPLATPDAPSALVLTRGNGRIDLTWAAPASDGGAAVSDYVIQYRLSSAASWTTLNDGTSTARTAAITGLTNGSLYFARVAAVNTAGTGAYSSTDSTTPMTTPSAPSAPSASRGNGQLSFSWTAPSDGGSAITDYVVEYKLASAGTWTTFTDGVSTATSTTVTGLTNGSSYNLRVSAMNSVGTGSVSSTATATPSTTADPVGALTANPGNVQVVLSWSAPASNGGASVTDYVIEYKLSSAGSWTTFNDGTSSNSSATVTGLTNGTPYDFRVAPVNAAGTGSYADPVASTPRTNPGAPTGLAATGGGARATLSWTAPASNGGSAITDYIIEFKLSSAGSWATFADGTSTGTSATVTGLTNGSSYDFRVSATNIAGAGTVSSTASTTPAAVVPGAPRNVVVSSGPGTMTLTWDEPADVGGSAITDYVIEIREASASSLSIQVAAWQVYDDGISTSSSATLTGFNIGTTYNIRVAAVNIAGTGPASNSVSGSPGALATSGGGVPEESATETLADDSEGIVFPGQGGLILVDGVPSNEGLLPSEDASGWLLQAPDLTLAFKPRASHRPTIELGPSRQLIAPVGGWIIVRGDGYQGSSTVSAYLIRRAQDPRALTMSDGGLGYLSPRSMAETRYVGETSVAADGTFSLRVDIPAGMATDDYVLQVKGTSPTLKPRSVNMAVAVTAEVTPRKGRVVKKAFFAPRSGKLTAEGLNDLRTIASRIPANAQNVMVEITGVSVSMGSIDRDIDLAAKRAKRIVKYLQGRGVTGTYQVSFMTSMTGPQVLRPRSGPKPLTTVNISYVVPTG